MGYSGDWIFTFIINNHTPYRLSVLTSHIAWGTWYLANSDGRGPIAIEPNKNGPALAIRAASGTATGYECACTWQFASPPGMAEDSVPQGTFSLVIDVPYTKDNKSSIRTSGFLRAGNWENLPPRGHHFTRTVDISEVK